MKKLQLITQAQSNSVVVVKGFQAYHYSWLAAHPHRTAEWLKDKLREGFDIHHLDNNHSNNEPDNLILIEHTDHMFLHARGRTLGRLTQRKCKHVKHKIKKARLIQYQSSAYSKEDLIERMFRLMAADPQIPL